MKDEPSSRQASAPIHCPRQGLDVRAAPSPPAHHPATVPAPEAVLTLRLGRAWGAICFLPCALLTALPMGPKHPQRWPELSSAGGWLSFLGGTEQGLRSHLERSVISWPHPHPDSLPCPQHWPPPRVTAGDHSGNGASLGEAERWAFQDHREGPGLGTAAGGRLARVLGALKGHP